MCTGEEQLLFDYWKGELPDFDPGQKLYVFVSHRHADHCNPEVFRFSRREGGVHFILSSLLLRYKKVKNAMLQYAVPDEEVSWVGADMQIDIDELGTVDTLKSTDEGVAFLVTLHSGKVIYHAGDLHWWNWKGEPLDWLRNMEVNYKKAVDHLKGCCIDIAFLVLDDRLEENYAQGMSYFLQTCHVKYVFPMHYWSDSGVVERYPREQLYGARLMDTVQSHHWELEEGE